MKFQSLADVVRYLFTSGKITRETSQNWHMAISAGMPAIVAAHIRHGFGMQTINQAQTGYYLLPA
jgi:hypothetical protein